MKAKFNILMSCFALLGSLGCQPSDNGAGAISADPTSSETYFPIRIGGHELMLQLALTPAEQQRGLMYRESLPEDHGMLFLFERPERRGFWMRNTGIPLDIGYFDATGRLREVRKLFPYNENTVPSASNAILIAVETNRGWFAAHDVGPGAQIDLAALRDAVKQRGHHPRLQSLQSD